MEGKSQEAEEFTKYYQKERVTKTYDKQRESSKYRIKKREKELKFFLELLDKQTGEKVLELGCSSGFLTKHLGKVIAIDTSKDMLKIAHSKNQEAKCIYADMFNLPFENNSFDKVVTMRVWNHLNEIDIKKVIGESARVLKKGGNLIFDTEDDSFLRRNLAKIYQKLTRITGFKIYQYSLNKIAEILNEEGFEILDKRFLKHRIGRQIILKTRLID